MRATRLSELVQQGRSVGRGGGKIVPAVADTSEGAREQSRLNNLPIGRARPRGDDWVVERVECLALELLAISKAGKSDPDSALREALLSMEECIAAIVARH